MAVPVGGKLPFRPDVVGSGFVEVAPTARFRARIRGTFYGEQVVLTERFSGRREVLDSYFLTSLWLSYDHSSRLTLYARFDNLLDQNYETAFDRRGIPVTGSVGFQISN